MIDSYSCALFKSHTHTTRPSAAGPSLNVSKKYSNGVCDCDCDSRNATVRNVGWYKNLAADTTAAVSHCRGRVRHEFDSRRIYNIIVYYKPVSIANVVHGASICPILSPNYRADSPQYEAIRWRYQRRCSITYYIARAYNLFALE